MTKPNNQEQRVRTELEVRFQGELKLVVKPSGKGLDVIVCPGKPDGQRLWAGGKVCITVEDFEPESRARRAPSAPAASDR